MVLLETNPETSTPFSRKELKEAFDQVKPRGNWKGPISKVLFLDEKQLPIVEQAVIFFTGSVPTFTVVKRRGGPITDWGCKKYRVRAAGYYAAVGA